MLLRWFFAHGADPDLSEQRSLRDRTGSSDTDSCVALEYISGRCDVEIVRMLLDASAKLESSEPPYYVAGVCPPGINLYEAPIRPGREFDKFGIPVMALVVERGADVNQDSKSRYVTARHPVVFAVPAGAVERG